MSTLDEMRARRYLLGQLSEEEAEALETSYFASAEALELISGIETDLVDAYVAGELAPGEQSAFESHYLASLLHQDRVASARSLRAATEDLPAVPAPRPRALALAPWLALAAGIILLLAAWWLKARPQPSARDIAQGEPTPVAVSTPSAGEPTREPATPAPRAAVAAFALSPVLLRSGQPTPVLRVPRGTDELALTLEGELPEGIASGARLAFTVTTVEGSRVDAGHLRATADGLGIARIPVARVPPGDYILSVRPLPGDATEGPLRQYFFRVASRERSSRWPGTVGKVGPSTLH